MIATDGRPTVCSTTSGGGGVRIGSPRIPAKDVDFRVLHDGSVSLLWPISNAGVVWASEHLPEDALTWGSAIAIEHRYVEPILQGIAEDGLVVGATA